ncbi:hypothetical protein H0G86_000323 [Trichoderma simmonsii]|uniref:Uncharacterized protein n=1 Tax=Trichoderma simmonsii TaxID=1491479 RepID=A0A8G0L4P9_9HYPO|nr:hypothetical protein H0G86_000323 [Trichoderma simmonsii]
MVVDYFTRFCWVFPCRGTQATEACTKLGIWLDGMSVTPMAFYSDGTIYKDNLKNFKDPKGGKGPALDLPLCNNYTRPSTQVSISQWISSPAMMPSIRRYRQSYHTTLAAAFKTETETEEVIEVIPATQTKKTSRMKKLIYVKCIYIKLEGSETRFLHESAQIDNGDLPS